MFVGTSDQQGRGLGIMFILNRPDINSHCIPNASSSSSSSTNPRSHTTTTHARGSSTLRKCSPCGTRECRACLQLATAFPVVPALLVSSENELAASENAACDGHGPAKKYTGQSSNSHNLYHHGQEMFHDHG